MKNTDTVNEPSTNRHVSIIIPVYNSTDYLDECLESILNQSESADEILLIDDGSDKESAEIMDAYKEKYALLRVFHISNRGQLGARLYGVSQAKNDWLIFADSDDILHPDTIKTLFNYLKEYDDQPDCIIYSFQKFTTTAGYEQKNKSNPVLLQNRYEIYKKLFNNESYNAVWRKMAKKSLFKTDYSSYYEVRFAEDLIQSIDIYKYSKSILVIDDVLYYYRIHTGSMSNSGKSKSYTIDNRPYELVYKTIIESNVFNEETWTKYNKHALLCFEEQIERLLLSKTTFSITKKQLKTVKQSEYYLNYISKIKAKLSMAKRIILFLFRHRAYLLLNLIGKLRKLKS